MIAASLTNSTLNHRKQIQSRRKLLESYLSLAEISRYIVRLVNKSSERICSKFVLQVFQEFSPVFTVGTSLRKGNADLQRISQRTGSHIVKIISKIRYTDPKHFPYGRERRSLKNSLKGWVRFLFPAFKVTFRRSAPRFLEISQSSAISIFSSDDCFQPSSICVFFLQDTQSLPCRVSLMQFWGSTRL